MLTSWCSVFWVQHANKSSAMQFFNLKILYYIGNQTKEKTSQNYAYGCHVPHWSMTADWHLSYPAPDRNINEAWQFSVWTCNYCHALLHLTPFCSPGSWTAMKYLWRYGDTTVLTLDTDLSWDMWTPVIIIMMGDNVGYYPVTGVTLMTLMMSTNNQHIAPCHTQYYMGSVLWMIPCPVGVPGQIGFISLTSKNIPAFSLRLKFSFM